MASFFTSIIFFVKINSSRGAGGALFYLVEIPEGWRGSPVPYKYGKSREVAWGGPK